jgi:hypothetical protein
MRALGRTATAVLLVVGSAMTAGTGAAQSTSENAAEAEVLFRDGRALVKAGRTSEACAKFAESHRLDPQIGTLLNLALCHEEEGKMASAWAEFNEVAERSGPTSERTGFAQRHALAAEAKLSKLRIRVEPDVTGLNVTLDGRPLRRAEFGLLIPLDPGAHTIEATAPGKMRWVERAELATGPVTQEVIVKLADPPESGTTTAPSSTASPSPAVPRSKTDAPTSAAPGAGRRTVGLVAGSIGLIGLGIGTGFGFRALHEKNTYDELCNLPAPNNCPSQRNRDLAAEAKNELGKAEIVSTVGFALGAVGLATGLYLLLTAPSSKPPNSVRISPGLGRGAAGVTMGVAF